jgi:hypothetical protein
MNPLLGYFRSAETALDEALATLVEPSTGGAVDPVDWALARDAFVTEARRALRHVAEREVSIFCAVCRRRNHFTDRTERPTATSGSAGPSNLASPLGNSPAHRVP